MLMMLRRQYRRGFMESHVVWDMAYMHFWQRSGDEDKAQKFATTAHACITGWY